MQGGGECEQFTRIRMFHRVRADDFLSSRASLADAWKGQGSSKSHTFPPPVTGNSTILTLVSLTRSCVDPSLLLYPSAHPFRGDHHLTLGTSPQHALTTSSASTTTPPSLYLGLKVVDQRRKEISRHPWNERRTNLAGFGGA